MPLRLGTRNGMASETLAMPWKCRAQDCPTWKYKMILNMFRCYSIYPLSTFPFNQPPPNMGMGQVPKHRKMECFKTSFMSSSIARTHSQDFSSGWTHTQQLMIGNLLDQTVDFPALKKHSWSPKNYEPHLVFSWNFILVLVLVVPPIFFMAFLHGTVWDIRGSHSGVSARREQVSTKRLVKSAESFPSDSSIARAKAISGKHV